MLKDRYRTVLTFDYPRCVYTKIAVKLPLDIALKNFRPQGRSFYIFFIYFILLLFDFIRSAKQVADLPCLHKMLLPAIYDLLIGLYWHT